MARRAFLTPGWRLAALFGAAFLLRLAVAWHLGLAVPATPGSDESEYIAYATSLATTGEYRGMSPDVADQNHLTAYRTPGTPMVYAAIFRVFGIGNVVAIRIANCLFGAAACVLLVWIGLLATGSDRVSWISGLIWCVYPRSLYFSASLLSEPLALLVFLGFMAVALQFARDRRVATAALAGVLLGFAILVHPTRLFAVPLVLLWLLLAFWRHRDAWVGAAVLPFVALLTVLPWPVRNWVVFHRVVPLTTVGGSALLQGNNSVVLTNPTYYGYSIWDTEIPEYAPALRSAGNEFARDSVAKSYALQWLRGHTRNLPALLMAKLVRGFSPLLRPPTPLAWRLLELVCWGPILLLMVAGFVPTWLRLTSAGQLVHLMSLQYVVVTLIFFGNTRYRYPVEPLYLLIAVMTAVLILPPLVRRRAPA